MSMTIRPNVTNKREYYISKYKFYEMKYHCLQYYEWRKEYNALSFSLRSIGYENDKVDTSYISDQTAELAIKRTELKELIQQVENAVDICGNDFRDALFEGVTKGTGFQALKAKYDIYCSRDEYYKALHKVYYLVSQNLHII